MKKKTYWEILCCCDSGKHSKTNFIAKLVDINIRHNCAFQENSQKVFCE